VSLTATGAFGRAGTLYPSQQDRPAGDIDLFVTGGSEETVTAMMAACGFKCLRPFPIGTFERGPVRVDFSLHLWDGLRLTRFATEKALVASLFDGWRDRVEPGPVAGISLLAPVDAHLFLALHYAYKHAFGRTIWLLDLALLWRTLTPPQRAAVGAVTGRAGLLLGAVMEEIHSVDGAAMEVYGVRQACHPIRRRLIRRAQAGPVGADFPFWLAWWVNPSLLFRLQCGWEMVLPSRVRREHGWFGAAKYLLGLPRRGLRLVARR
jgi:hypothetical protein